MSSYLREIADALADGLAAVPWEISSTMVYRRNWVSIDPDGMGEPVIFVVPGNASVSRVSRTMSQVDYTVTCFVGRLVATDQMVDDMIDLADTALRYVRAHDWSNAESWPEGVTSPMEIQVEMNPDDALSERNVWRAVITATYRVFQSDALPE